MHYGIKGQKWGVRRYQNTDGSWTAAGRARYSKGSGKRAKTGYGAKYLYAYPDPDGTSPLNTNKKLIKLNNKIAKNNKQLSKIDAHTLGLLNRYNDDGRATSVAEAIGIEHTARQKYANKDAKLREKRRKLVDKITGVPNSGYVGVGIPDGNDFNDVANAFARGYTKHDNIRDYTDPRYIAAGFKYAQGNFKDFNVSPYSDTSQGNTYNTRAINQLKYGKKKSKTNSNISSDTNGVWDSKSAPKAYKSDAKYDWSTGVYNSKDAPPKLKKAALKHQLMLQKAYSSGEFDNKDDFYDYVVEMYPDRKNMKKWKKFINSHPDTFNPDEDW